MALFDKAWKKEQAAYVFQAYWQVMAGITVNDAVKKKLYPQVEEGLLSGGTGLENICSEALLPLEWTWPDFDRWEAIFEQQGQYPCMWFTYTQKRCFAQMDDMEYVVQRWRIGEVKKIVEHLQLTPPPKAKKEQLVAMLLQQNLTAQKVKQIVPEWAEEMCSKYSAEMKREQCHILAGTVSHTYCSIRDFNSTTKRIVYSSVHNCPVEKKYAADKNGKVVTDIAMLPPYFPGDRTHLTPNIDEW